MRGCSKTIGPVVVGAATLLALAGLAGAQDPADAGADAGPAPSADAGPAPSADAGVTDPVSDEAVLAVAAGEGEGEVIEMVGSIPPGAAHVVDARELDRFERDDVHKVLAAVPGVYIREEDGYGLRPNIGMRGTGADRSAKIALLEDGVLIAPAPYSAPAAYYFPLVTRTIGVEVVKGPASIRFGPNTVGGVVNLLTREIPRQREASLDLAGGSHLYGKGHVVYGETLGRVGWLIEGVKLRTDGFKELDGGGDTGFSKHDVMAKLRAQTSPYGIRLHTLELKLGYGDETSNETYTGLTDADFAAQPYRRYVATQLDRMTWRHGQAQLSYKLITGGTWSLAAQLYRHDFDRDWRKLGGFADDDRDLREILANPTAGNNAVFFAVLTGAADSSSPAETLLIGTNGRRFVAEGLQLVARGEHDWLGASHGIELGARLHYDRVHRLHVEDGHLMQAGTLVPDGGPTETTRDAVDSSLAWAAYYAHRVELGAFSLIGGARAELIWIEHRDQQAPELDHDGSYFVLIPGGGVVWQPRVDLGFLVGVHRGFVPVAPEDEGTVDPETSVNYEAGLRYAKNGASLETIGFFSDYGNLVGTCTFSSGCQEELAGQTFAGGKVHSYGLELLATAELAAGFGLRAPLRLGYTFQRSIFRQSFTSDNPQWGDIEQGDELPYLPAHQLHAQAAVGGVHWEVALAGRYTSAMRDTAGQGEAPAAEWTDAAWVLDAAARVRWPRWGELYVTVDNVLDEAHITSRRPFAARPGVPRLVLVGYKNSL
jgi:Fe(3+) dicitrate transport protein